MYSTISRLVRRTAKLVVSVIDSGLRQLAAAIGHRPKTVLFDIYNNIGFDAQAPVIRELLKYPSLKIRVTSGVLRPAELRPMLERSGLATELMSSPASVLYRRYGLVVTTENTTARRLRRSPVAYLHHGSSAGDRAIPFGLQSILEGTADYLFCVSAAEAELCTAICGVEAAQKAIITGQPKLDSLCASPAIRERFLASLGLDPTLPTALIYSHWTETSLFRSQGVDWIRECFEGFSGNIIISGHKHLFNIQRTGKDWHSTLSQTFNGPADRVVRLVEDMWELLVSSDFLIGDHSSTVLEYSVLMRPVFVYRNPAHKYSDTKLDELLEGAATVVSAPEGLPVARSIQSCLSPGQIAARRILHEHAFGFLGNSAQRTAEVIAGITRMAE